ncbi:unnamed protein product [Heterotrigona itama]|uniref:Cytochrome c oxidase subunit 3 n=1 Tax=Heterotrigona itama TaxID=395501 RepID=A0A6V7GYD1_9HYME|nr:unnamed protein product [Heterotrigona itama]
MPKEAQLLSGGMSFYYNIEERTDALTWLNFMALWLLHCMRIEHFSGWQKNDYTNLSLKLKFGSISPAIEINTTWPPKIIKVFNYTEIPLLNTFTSITSGFFFITLRHLHFINNNFYKRIKMLLFTIIIGLYFPLIQLIENIKIHIFCFNDRIYRSIYLFIFLSTRISWNSCPNWNININYFIYYNWSCKGKSE